MAFQLQNAPAMTRYVWLLILIGFSLAMFACGPEIMEEVDNQPDARTAVPGLPDAAPGEAVAACDAPNPMILGSSMTGSKSNDTFVQISWTVGGTRTAMLQLRGLDDQTLSTGYYDLSECFTALVGSGDIFACEARLWMKYPLADGDFEQYIASEGLLDVSNLDLGTASVISLDMDSLVLTRVAKVDGANDYDIHPEPCTRVITDPPSIRDLVLAVVSG